MFFCHVTPHSLVDSCYYLEDASIRFLQNTGTYLHGAPSQMTALPWIQQIFWRSVTVAGLLHQNYIKCKVYFNFYPMETEGLLTQALVSGFLTWRSGYLCCKNVMMGQMYTCIGCHDSVDNQQQRLTRTQYSGNVFYSLLQMTDHHYTNRHTGRSLYSDHQATTVTIISLVSKGQQVQCWLLPLVSMI
jgi:hypothetical protein